LQGLAGIKLHLVLNLGPTACWRLCLGELLHPSEVFFKKKQEPPQFQWLATFGYRMFIAESYFHCGAQLLTQLPVSGVGRDQN